MESMTASGARSPGSGQIAFAECADVDDATFARLYKDVLEPSFRPTELNSLEDMYSAYHERPIDHFGTIALRQGEPVGAALGEHDPVSGVMLLAYLAVRPDQRGQGTGSAILSHVLPRWRLAVRPVTILAEVEDPRFYETSQYGDPMARLRMYDRHGWRLLPMPYFQPALARGQSRVHGMLLISFATDSSSIPACALTTFLDRYMESCEGREVVEEDPEYLILRQFVVNNWPGGVPLWPISRASEVPIVEF